ncbi:MAG: hypothetical protein Q9190_003760 [Brigantiaea leucoxantha]
MSEVRSKPSGSRSRGLGRGGRGGYSSRGGRAGHRQVNGDSSDVAVTPSYEDEGEIGELKRRYSSKLVMIKEMFPDWTDEDIVFALQETGGNLEETIDRISEGTAFGISSIPHYPESRPTDVLNILGSVAQWGEVKKKTKDRSQPKAKEPLNSGADTINTSSRSGRGRGHHEGPRGGRGRGSERGRGAGRGGRAGSSVNGPHNSSIEKPAIEAPASTEWGEAPKSDGVVGNGDKPADSDGATLDSSWENINPSDAVTTPAVEQAKASSKPDGTRSWASIFNKPAPTAAPIPILAKKATQEALIQERSPELPASVPPQLDEADMAALPPPLPLETTDPNVPSTPSPGLISTEPQVEITPSKDELTETNVEQVLDTSGPPNTATAASTVASTADLRNSTGNGTALHTAQQQPSGRPPMGGYATSAFKAAGIPGRSASYQRKILEQQEAVVMPGKHAVDRAAVQFGSMGLNGPTEDLDVDDEREESETRAQPPQHSPIAPRASLPPVPQQSQTAPFPSQAQMDEPLPAPRQAPGLPPVNNQPATHQTMQPSNAEQSIQSQPHQSSYGYNQFGNRYGAQPAQQEASAPSQKAYEPFGHQQPHSAYENYNTTSQPQQQPHHQSQSHLGGFSSPSDMSSYYTSDNQRNSYSTYYGGFPQNPQEGSSAQNRAGSAFGSSSTEQPSHATTSQGPPPAQSRYAQPSESQASGSSTPNPAAPSQNHSQHVMQQQPHSQSGGQHGGYPYGHPYYAGPYYSAYMNQVSNHPYGRERPMFDDVRRYDEHYLTHNPQFGYGGGPFGAGAGAGKSGLYGQPHQAYGMSPQTSYDQHSASPALGGFGQQHSTQSREAASSSNMGSYNRSGSTQPSEPQQQYSSNGSGGYGNMPDMFSRNQSGYQAQNQGLGHQPSGQQSGNDDPLRGFGETSKGTGGPSPAPGARPGSAVNALQSQAGVAPPQGQSQQGYGGYAGHLNHQMHGQHGSQYAAGPAGLSGGHHGSGAQSHQGGGYGAYGAGFGGSYYGNNTRGGWGGNYGH